MVIANVQIQSWDDLRVLHAIGAEGSLAGAARRLKVNHSTVFRRLQAAESRLGVRVFERRADGYTPTAAGQEILGHAGRMDEAAVALERSAVGADARLSGSVRLTTAPNLAADYVAGYLPEFQQSHPDVQLEIMVGDREFDLARREADLALRATGSPVPYLVGRKVVELTWWVCAGSAYLRDHAPPTSMQDLVASPLVGAEASFLRVAPFAWVEQNIPAHCIVARANDLQTMAALAIAGIGLVLLPSDQHRDGLERLFPLQPEFPSALWLLTHPDLRQVARIRTFAEFLAQKLRSDPRLG